MNVNKTNTPNNTMYETQPAVSALNKVPGFNPLNFIRKTVSSGTYQEIWHLDLKYKRLWFRLKYPKGSIQKNNLQITDKMAVIEAKLFLDRNDKEPVAVFIAEKYAMGGKKPLHIQAAQEEAEHRVLNDAGFGIQFCDIIHENDTEISGAELPAGKTISANVKPDAPVNKKPQAAKPEVSKTAEPKSNGAANQQPEISAQTEAPAEQKQEKSNVPAQPETCDITETTAANQQPESLDSIIAKDEAGELEQAEFPGPADSVEQKTDEPAAQTENRAAADSTETAAEQQNEIAEQSAESGGTNMVEINSMEIFEETEPVPQNLNYTKDTPVEDILKIMTLEEAGLVVVDAGSCTGKTMCDVLDIRPGTLKWLQNGYTGKNNIMRAAAAIMYQYHEKQQKEQKAS